MTTSTARVSTTNGSRYLQQLCKHWGHRFAVEFDPVRGRIDFGGGETVTLEAADETLLVAVAASPGSEPGKLERVVAEHLKRFAFREELDFRWSREDASS